MVIPTKCECRSCKNTPTRLIYSYISSNYYYVCSKCPPKDGEAKDEYYEVCKTDVQSKKKTNKTKPQA